MREGGIFEFSKGMLNFQNVRRQNNNSVFKIKNIWNYVYLYWYFSNDILISDVTNTLCLPKFISYNSLKYNGGIMSRGTMSGGIMS